MAAQAIAGVTVEVESWAEHVPKEAYDAVISVGAFEHFARREASDDEKLTGYREFFLRCHGWLRPGGWLSLQTIADENSRRQDFSAFFAVEVFPESDLPSLWEIARACEHLFEIVQLCNDREQYARTIKEWLRRLRSRRAEATALVGEDVVSRYEKYFRHLIIGFHTGTMGLLRLALRRIG